MAIIKSLSLDEFKEKVVCRFINPNYCEIDLSQFVKKEMFDFNIVYQTQIADKTVFITKNILDFYGISEDQLHEMALENMKHHDVIFCDLRAAIKAAVFDANSAPSNLKLNSPNVPLGDLNFLAGDWINEFESSAASVILVPGVLEKISQKMNGNFFIIGSSTNELLTFKETDKRDPAEAYDIMIRMNTSQVYDISLTDQLLIYDNYHKKIMEYSDYLDLKTEEYVDELRRNPSLFEQYDILHHPNIAFRVAAAKYGNPEHLDILREDPSPYVRLFVLRQQREEDLNFLQDDTHPIIMNEFAKMAKEQTKMSIHFS